MLCYNNYITYARNHSVTERIDAQLIKLIELTAFAVSAAAFGCGAVRLFGKGTPKYFQLFVCAAGCYMLEELWVIVNSLLGSGSLDGLVTVRLFGFFGCLCFMLSANANGFDRAVDESNSVKARALSFIAPAVLLGLYAAYALATDNESSVFNLVIGFLSLSPALFASRLNLKHLLLPEDAMGFLKAARGIDMLSLVFYAANYLYPPAYLYCSKTLMGIYDVVLAVILLMIVLLCGKGAKKWKALV